MKGKTQRLVVGMGCILASLLLSFGIAPWMQEAKYGLVSVVQVVTPIEVGSPIQPEQVRLVEVGSYGLPQTLAKNLDSVVGSYVSAPLYAGDFVLLEKVGKEPFLGEEAYLSRLDGTWHMMSVSIQGFAQGLSGKLEAGDVVSLISYQHLEQGKTLIPEELTYVEVVSMTADSGKEVEAEAGYGEEDAELPSTITLLVTPRQGVLLAELEQAGEIHVALVYRGDGEIKEGFLAQQRLWLEALETEEKVGEEIREEEED